MFTKYAITIVSLLIFAQPASATRRHSNNSPERICKREFAHDLFKCVVTTYFQRPKVRGDKLRTCVMAAKNEKLACLGGGSGDPGQCEATCQATYDANAAICQTTYNPAACNGDPICESQYQQDRANCISVQVDQLNSCTQACQ